MKTHKNMTNQEIARLLDAVAAALEVRDKDKFRQRAYENAASSIEHTATDLKILWKENKLESIPGIGKNLASHLDELFRTGKVKHFEKLTKGLPAGMFELLSIPGIGPKTALKLARQLKLKKGTSARRKLLQAAQKGQIQKLEGFAQTSEQAIKAGIEEDEKRKKEKRIPLAIASSIADEIISYLKTTKLASRLDCLGSLRRRNSTVGDIDLAAATLKPQKLINYFVEFPQVKKILAKGSNTARVILSNNLQVDLKTQTPNKYGALLQHFTGSKKHNIHLREIALKKHLSLSEHGIKHGNQTQSFKDEVGFYHKLGLEWIPPELREDSGEIEASLQQAQGKPGALPHLVELKDIKGDLHTHSDYPWISSHDAGSNTFKELAQKAEGLGYSYLGVGDHNPSISSYSPKKIMDEIKRRNDAIDKLMYSREKQVKKRGVKLLKTLEIDIRTNGELSVPDKAIDLLDYAVVSVHSSFHLNKAKMTKRLIRGLAHPKAKILGHPTGRLIGKRPGYEINWDKLFDFCAQHHKVIEVNAHPSRLDLPDVLVKDAIHNGVLIAVSTDAHSVDQMDLMRFGIDVARRGWAEKAHIFNCLPWKKLRDIIKK